jgi:hypothetical protein
MAKKNGAVADLLVTVAASVVTSAVLRDNGAAGTHDGSG